MNPDPSQLQTLSSTTDPSLESQYTLTASELADAQQGYVSTGAPTLVTDSPTLNEGSAYQYDNSSTTRPATRKRKPAAPGSRGVATLTAEQLSKKRANDREAQRAIRERTKSTITKLEQRIRDLESQQPYQDLQRAIAERDQALADCAELKQRLAAVAGIVGSGQAGLNGVLRAGFEQALQTDTSAESADLTTQELPLNPSEEPSLMPPAGLAQSELNVDVDQTAMTYNETSPEATQQQHLDPDLRSAVAQTTDGVSAS